MTDPVMGADEPGLSAALTTLKGLLTTDETLEAWAVQHRLYALTHRRVCIAATSGRFSNREKRIPQARNSTPHSPQAAHACW